jgi:hypothetical protein
VIPAIIRCSTPDVKTHDAQVQARTRRWLGT